MTETGVLTARGLRPLADPVVRWAERRGTTAAAMARAGGVLTVVAAVWFTAPTLLGRLAGVLALALVLYCDAVGDRLGERGRDTLTAWSVSFLVHLREFVLYAALAVGADLDGRADAWAWAAGALVAYAVRESVVAARAARYAPVLRDAEEERLSPIEAIDPSRTDRDDSDPEFTAELLGGPPAREDTEPGGLVRIRTAPPRRDGGRRLPDGDRSGTAEPERGPARLRKGSGLLWDLVAFGPSERFLVIAATVTIWDVSAAFPALVAGFAVAVAGAAMTPRRHTP
ncbi:hypothetical protein [Thermobifida cellulosilytica]|uniref:CDP-alcohol phosphatidyltransferase n=1 Tax=Thermobifida cellulosilytica TB100 TaxID=665004 RepID=A0A147KG57_THECS|nr:hypothetical protein [Thermobifida cellulosilytica]KUP96250.1 hypothetical protein AC529_13185 [Thermobifida cellulosilytica TB100]